MTKRKIICSQQKHCLSCPISTIVTGKDCRHLTQKEIDNLVYKEYNFEYKNNISNNIIKYCYKADNVYNFERRLYFLSLLIENKIIKEINKNEVKKNSNSEKHR